MQIGILRRGGAGAAGVGHKAEGERAAGRVVVGQRQLVGELALHAQDEIDQLGFVGQQADHRQARRLSGRAGLHRAGRLVDVERHRYRVTVGHTVLDRQVHQIAQIDDIRDGLELPLNLIFLVADALGRKGVLGSDDRAALGSRKRRVGEGHRLLVGVAQRQHAHLEGERDLGVGGERTLPVHHLLRRIRDRVGLDVERGQQRRRAAGRAGDVHIVHAAAVDGGVDDERVGQRIADLCLDGLRAAIVAQANLVSHIVDPLGRFGRGDHALLQFERAVLPGRRRRLEDVFGLTKEIAVWIGGRVRAAAVGQGAGWLHSRRLAEGEAQPVLCARRAIEHLLGVNGEVKRAARRHCRHVHDVVLHDPLVARLCRAGLVGLAGADVLPVAVAVAVEPDVENHEIARGAGRLADAHVQRRAPAVEELDLAVAPAVVAAIVVGHVADRTARRAQDVVRAVLVQPDVGVRLTREEIAQPAFHALVGVARAGGLSGSRPFPHGGEAARHAGIGAVDDAVVVAAVRRITKIGPRAVIDLDGVVDDQPRGDGAVARVGAHTTGSRCHTAQRDTKVVLRPGQPSLEQRLDGPVDVANGRRILDRAGPRHCRLGVPRGGGLAPRAVDPPHLDVERIGGGVDVEAELRRVDRGAGRQRREIEAHEIPIEITARPRIQHEVGRAAAGEGRRALDDADILDGFDFHRHGDGHGGRRGQRSGAGREDCGQQRAGHDEQGDKVSRGKGAVRHGYPPETHHWQSRRTGKAGRGVIVAAQRRRSVTQT